MQPNAKHFLLVEDDQDHAEIVLHSIKQHDVPHTVDHVWDGVAALQYLRGEGEYASRKLPDVVLLDLKLPKLDGLEVLESIKNDALLRSLPVVILTTSDAEIDRAKAYHSHANSYVVKPVDFKSFVALVEDLSVYWGEWNRGPR